MKMLRYSRTSLAAAFLLLSACGAEEDPGEAVEAVLVPVEPQTMEAPLPASDASVEETESAAASDPASSLPPAAADTARPQEVSRQAETQPAAPGPSAPAAQENEVADPHAGHDMSEMPDHDMSGM
jgi:hypothetical protein